MEKEKWTPETLVEKLKENVIGQDRYLKDLCTSVWMHSLSKEAEERSGYALDGVKLNMLVLGKSGTGKTFAIQSLAKLLNLNLVIEDASVFTGAGWKGREVSSIVKDILLSADKEPLKAEYSIVVLDEIDKVFSDSARTGSFSAWNNFLKLIEGTDTEYVDGQTVYQMNTEKVLFICLGAFDGLEEIIKKRINSGSGIGFCTQKTELPDCDIFQYVEKEDLINYGVNPQFLGRMAMITATNELKGDDYVRILMQSKSSAVSRINTVLQTSMGVRATITQKAAQYIAQKAVREQTGGRTLLFEVTEALKDGIYQIADREDVKELCLKYTSAKELKVEFVKGKRKKPPIPYRQPEQSFIEESWEKIPLEIMEYGCSLSGVYQYVEEMTETVELEGHGLSGKYSYRRIRAAVYLIMSAVLCVMTDDIPQNLFEVAREIFRLVSYPPVYDYDSEKADTYARIYWKSLEYEEDAQSSRELAIYMIREYCSQRKWEEAEYRKTVS